MNTAKLKQRVKDGTILVLLVLLMALPGLSSLPVIDRDEARYAQASVQMIETGDYVNIRFQDRARNKKPAGSYWAQTVSVKAFSDPNNRAIWAHRLPSVLAGIIAVLACYWGGVRMIGRKPALIGAGLFAVSFIFVFEAHIAKTDALLVACAALILGAFGHLRNGGGRRSALIVWAALGCAVMIKGPLIPILVLLTILTLLIWERKASWLKPLLFFPGPFLFLAIVAPWTYLIYKETGGAFFTDAIGGDLAPKMTGGQESHGGPPGYHSALIWIAFWPACLFLLPGLAFAARAGRNKTDANAPVAKAARLLLCWSVPFFILLELTPTKLPHYPLPIYPALALMCAAAMITMTELDEFKRLRRIGAAIFMIVSIAIMSVLLFAESYFGSLPTWTFAVMGIAIILCIVAAQRLWNGRSYAATICAMSAAILVSFTAYIYVLPSMTPLKNAKAVKLALIEAGETLPLTNRKLISTQFTEPSLVYHLGTGIVLGQPEVRLSEPSPEIGSVIILDTKHPANEKFAPAYAAKLLKDDLCLSEFSRVEGYNYAKGDPVDLRLNRIEACPEAITSEPMQ